MAHHEKKVSAEEMMLQIQEVGFALVELNLYLDTHPWDQQALANYNSLSHRYQTLCMEYEALAGPMKNLGHSMSAYPWRWNDAPWPWQM